MDGIIRKPQKAKVSYNNNRQSSHSLELLNQPKNNKAEFDSTGRFDNLFAKPPQALRPPKKKNRISMLKKVFIFIFTLSILVILSLATYFLWKVNSVNSKINNNSSGSVIETVSKIVKSDRVALSGEDRGRVNVLLLGIAGEGRAGGSLTDTIMIASIETATKKTSLLSLPRDLYVKIPDSNYSAKINSIYKYGLSKKQGVSPLVKTIENITGLKIDYYLIASFAGFEKFIDDIDGIVINNERDIYDPSYPGPNYSYELFALKKGTHLLNGATALKYARERHDDPQGDFGRAKRQQQVMQSIKSRVFSTKVLLNPFAINKLLDTLGESINTNISLEEMESFLDLSKELDTQNVTNIVVDAWKDDSLLKVSHIFYENIRAFILIPRVGNYSEIRDVAQNIFSLDNIKKRKEEIKKEEASIAIINKSGENTLPNKLKVLLEDKLGFSSVTIISSKSQPAVFSTQIIDLSNGQKPFSLDELIKKLPAQLSVDQISNNNLEKYDLVAIIGSDLTETYSFEESSMEEMQKNENELDNNEILIPKNNEK